MLRLKVSHIQMANRLGCTVLAWDLPQISDLLSVRVGVNSEITGNKAGKMMDRSKMRSKSKSVSQID